MNTTSYEIEIFIWDFDGRQLKGVNRNGSSPVFAFEHRAYLPVDIELTKIQGVRKFEAFYVTKLVDSLTPQLANTITNGKTLKTVQISLYKTSVNLRERTEYFRYVLEHSKIISLKNRMDLTRSAESKYNAPLEEIAFLYRTFTWAFIQENIEYSENIFDLF